MSDICKEGHLLIPSNILISWSKDRSTPTIRCRECRRIAAEKQSRKRGILKRGTIEYRKALFEKHIVKTDTCWIFIGYTDAKGYGRVGNPNFKNLSMAHRYSYELYKEPIPEGLQLDHKCENKSCVNPEHLQPVTNLENQQLYWERKRMKSNLN